MKLITDINNSFIDSITRHVLHNSFFDYTLKVWQNEQVHPEARVLKDAFFSSKSSTSIDYRTERSDGEQQSTEI